MNEIEIPIDVREIAPRLRHPLIFNTWNELPIPGTILLINDHDPVPLYYQFAAEHSGHFQWVYLEEGPAVWKVQITKGNFPHPGFIPGKKIEHRCVESKPITFAKPIVLDTRPFFDRGETPCHEIDQAAATVIPGQSLTLLVPFEPVPLVAKLGKQGFKHYAEQLADGTWKVEFQKSV